MANSNEHDRFGYSTEYMEERNEQVSKRLRKVDTMLREGLFPASVVTGDPYAEVGFISYGGNFGPITDAMETLAQEGRTTKFLRLRTLWPFPVDDVRRFVDSSRRVYVVEQNATGQLRKLIQMEVAGPSEKLVSLLRDDGRPFVPRQIVEEVHHA